MVNILDKGINTMKIKEWKANDIVGVVLLCYGLFILAKLTGLCFSEDIWYDEVFSVGMMRYSYKDIVNFTARDVHPPLYYWYLKTMADIGTNFFHQIDAVVFAKLASVLPMAVLWILAVTKLRNEFGLFVSGMFVFCAYSMPQITVYGVEIRMYSFALCLVTLAYFYGYQIYKTKNTKAFIGMFICGILTAYTQYFSCIAIVILYLLVGIAVLKNKEAIIKWLFSVVASIVCYLPWIGTLIKQFTSISGNYWIQPLTWRAFPGCVKYIYLPSTGYALWDYVLAVLMILATFVLAFLYLKKRKSIRNCFTEEGFSVLLALVMLLGTIFIGIAVSILVSPVFVYRYMIPCLGAYWFVYALLLNDCKKKRIRMFILAITLCVGTINVKGVFWGENYKAVNMKETQKGLDSIEQDDILIFNFNHVQATVGYYKDNESYLLYQEAETLIQDIYQEYGMINDVNQIKELVQKGKKVWFLGSFNSREDIVNEWEQQGLKVTEQGSYLLERYWFNLYSVE